MSEKNKTPPTANDVNDLAQAGIDAWACPECGHVNTRSVRRCPCRKRRQQTQERRNNDMYSPQ